VGGEIHGFKRKVAFLAWRRAGAPPAAVGAPWAALESKSTQAFSLFATLSAAQHQGIPNTRTLRYARGDEVFSFEMTCRAEFPKFGFI